MENSMASQGVYDNITLNTSATATGSMNRRSQPANNIARLGASAVDGIHGNRPSTPVPSSRGSAALPRPSQGSVWSISPLRHQQASAMTGQPRPTAPNGQTAPPSRVHAPYLQASPSWPRGEQTIFKDGKGRGVLHDTHATRVTKLRPRPQTIAPAALRATMNVAGAKQQSTASVPVANANKINFDSIKAIQERASAVSKSGVRSQLQDTTMAEATKSRSEVAPSAGLDVQVVAPPRDMTRLGWGRETLPNLPGGLLYSYFEEAFSQLGGDQSEAPE